MQHYTTDTWVTHPWVAEAQHIIRFGVSAFDQGADWTLYRDWVQMAEHLGFDSCWAVDHPLYCSDCWTSLTALAVMTSKIRLGSLVSCISYRSPTLLARMAADVDRLSNGRLILGLGIGDFLAEFEQLGIPVLSMPERQRALEEAIQVILGLWGKIPFTYHGTYFQVNQAKMPYRPMQQPHVPLLIAGGGERVTLRQVAQYADASNFGAHTLIGSAFCPDDVVRKYDILRSHCEARGRPYESVLRSHLTFPLVLAETHDALSAKLAAVPQRMRALFQSSTITATPQEAIAHYQTLVKAGVRYFIISLLCTDVETLHLLAQQVVPALAQK